MSSTRTTRRGAARDGPERALDVRPPRCARGSDACRSALRVRVEQPRAARAPRAGPARAPVTRPGGSSASSCRTGIGRDIGDDVGSRRASTRARRARLPAAPAGGGRAPSRRARTGAPARRRRRRRPRCANASRRPAHSRQRSTGQAVGAPQRAQRGSPIGRSADRHATQRPSAGPPQETQREGSKQLDEPRRRR